MQEHFNIMVRFIYHKIITCVIFQECWNSTDDKLIIEENGKL